MSVSRWSLILVAAAIVVGLSAADTQAQGCVASRMNAPNGPVDREGNSYYLTEGHWQASFGYRHYRSHRHFVGDVEQSAENVANGTAERDRSTSEVINKVNISDLSLGYGINDRLSLTLDVPVLLQQRSGPPRAASATSPAIDRFWTSSNGIGDTNVMGRWWVADPSKHSHQNVSLGVGFKLPTGKDDVQDDFIVAANPTTLTTVHRPVDQSIQLGDGGLGFVTEVTAFKAIGRVSTFGSLSYLFNPKEQGPERDPTSTNPNPATQYFSVSDQIAARLGAGTSFNKLGVSLSARMEGVPSSDVFGGSKGFRRPGYSIAIEPGLSYSWKRNALSVSVPYLVHRVRTQSYSDKLASTPTKLVNGDAAFADYIIIAGFSTRF